MICILFTFTSEKQMSSCIFHKEELLWRSFIIWRCAPEEEWNFLCLHGNRALWRVYNQQDWTTPTLTCLPSNFLVKIREREKRKNVGACPENSRFSAMRGMFVDSRSLCRDGGNVPIQFTCLSLRSLHAAVIPLMSEQWPVLSHDLASQLETHPFVRVWCVS